MKLDDLCDTLEFLADCIAYEPCLHPPRNASRARTRSMCASYPASSPRTSRCLLAATLVELQVLRVAP